MNQSTLSEIENDKSDPQFSTIVMVAGALLLKAQTNLFEVLGRQLEDDPLGALEETPTVQSHQSDTPIAAPAHAHSESQGGAGVIDEHWEDLKGIYRTASRGLDELTRKQLIDAIEELALRFKQERMKGGAKKASGE